MPAGAGDTGRRRGDLQHRQRPAAHRARDRGQAGQGDGQGRRPAGDPGQVPRRRHPPLLRRHQQGPAHPWLHAAGAAGGRAGRTVVLAGEPGRRRPRGAGQRRTQRARTHRQRRTAARRRWPPPLAEGGGEVRGAAEPGGGYPMTQHTTLITGGAGFVGSNLAHRLLSLGRRVRILDNLSRPGVEQNLQWLRQQHGELLEFVRADVRDAAAVNQAVAGTQQVFHFAAQVAVTTSLENPREDFEVNALGTLNVLEAARVRPVPPAVLMTSTNKVYGGLEDLDLSVQGQRYLPVDATVAGRGI